MIKCGARFTAEWDGELMDFTSPSLLQFWSFLKGIREGQPAIHLLDRQAPLEIIDAGGCIGAWSMSMIRRLPNAHILALEPCSVSYPHLVRNLRGWNVTTRKVAADEKPGKVTIQLPTTEEYSQHKEYWWRAKGNIGMMSAYGSSGEQVEEVETVRLDDICPRADLIKLDVEGMELRVLAGATRLLSAHPVLQVELSRRNQERAGHTVEELIKYLEAKGYVLVALQRQMDGIFVGAADAKSADEILSKLQKDTPDPRKLGGDNDIGAYTRPG